MLGESPAAATEISNPAPQDPDPLSGNGPIVFDFANKVNVSWSRHRARLPP